MDVRYVYEKTCLGIVTSNVRCSAGTVLAVAKRGGLLVVGVVCPVVRGRTRGAKYGVKLQFAGSGGGWRIQQSFTPPPPCLEARVSRSVDGVFATI